MTEYELPTINNLPSGGSMKCFLYVDSSVGALTIPDTVSVLSITPLKESVDISAGQTDLQNVTVSLSDNYDDYADGFWFNLIEGNPLAEIQMLFILTESGSDTYYYRGSLFRESVQWRELYISGSDAIRTVEAQFISPIQALKNVTTADLITYITDTHPEIFCEIGKNERVTAEIERMVTVKNILAAMIELALDLSEGTAAVISRGADIIVYNDRLAEWYDPLDGYFWVQSYDSDFSSYRDTWSPYNLSATPLIVDTTNQGALWITRYSNCFDLLKSITNSLGVVPRYYYGDSSGIYQGDANDAHTLELVIRGRTGDYLTNAKLTESTMVSNTALKNINVVTHGIGNYATTMHSWIISGNYESSNSSNYDENAKISIENSQFFDLLYYVYEGSLVTSDDTLVSTENHFAPPTKVAYYDYRSSGPSAWVEAVNTYIYNRMNEALTKYLAYRFSSKRKEYTRTYGTMAFNNGSTTTHQNARIMAKTTINSESFYASEVTKDVSHNKTTIKWMQM